jgi:hypothetical protein
MCNGMLKYNIIGKKAKEKETTRKTKMYVGG